MKILYHHRTQAADGQYVHISELTHALQSLGHEIVMVGPGGNEKRKMDAGTDSGPSLRDRLPAWLYELLEFGYSGLAFLKLWKAYRAHKPDVLYERYNIFCLSGAWHGIDKVIDLLAGDRLPPEAHLLMVGDGPARADLEDQARRLGVSERVTFTGVVQRDAVPHYVAAFDIALQPHVVAYASPLKLIEYLALGRAIVGPATPNIQEILTDGETGLLFEPGNTDAFAEAIVHLANDPVLRKRLGDAALALLQSRDLTWRHNAERVVRLFQAMPRR